MPSSRRLPIGGPRPKTRIRSVWVHQELPPIRTAPPPVPLVVETYEAVPQPRSSERLDLCLFVTYFLHSITITLPVVLVPLIANDLQVPVASFAARVASLSTMGGGLGKLVNGFVCQSLGGSTASSLYLIGAATSLGALATLSQHVGPLLMALEFCASIQWTAMLLVLSNHYGSQLSSRVGLMTLASTSGMMATKLAGSALLQVVPWRVVAIGGSVLAFLAAAIMQLLVAEQPTTGVTLRPLPSYTPRGGSKDSSLGSVRSLFQSRLFWQAGLGHALIFLVKTMDRLVGSFYQDVVGVRRDLCGALTTSVTVGLLHGLGSGSKRADETTLKRCYRRAVLSCLGLAACAYPPLSSLLFPNRVLWTVSVALLSGVVASSLALQFYQLPPLVSANFGSSKSVCLSFMDGMGFFMSATLWVGLGQLVGSPHGWTKAFVACGALFASGGLCMLNALPQAKSYRTT